MKKPFLAALSGLVVLTSVLHAADLTADYTWKQMKIGGGGWVVGMDMSPTEKGLIYCRTDVSGAYRWNPDTSTWKQIVTAETLPQDFVVYGKYGGVDSIVSAPKDPNIAYLAFKNQVFRSTNKGDTWDATTFKTLGIKTEAVGDGAKDGERLGVDPVNSDVVYFCPAEGVPCVTEDAGATWKKVDGIPAGKPKEGCTTIVFDKGSGTVKSAAGKDKTKVAYITVDHEGIFKTEDAGATWTNIAAGGPGTLIAPHDAAIGPDRTYYVTCGSNKTTTGSVWKLAPEGTWTQITPNVTEEKTGKMQGGNIDYAGVAIDPADGKHVVVIVNGGRLFNSTDGGATWNYQPFHFNSANIEWLGKQTTYFLGVGEIEFDPFEPGKLWLSEGFGMWWTKDLTTPKTEWQAVSEGIEEMCGNDIIAPPGGQPVGAMFDLGAFYFKDIDSYNAIRSQPYFMACWALDWCASDPKFMAGIFRNNLSFPPHPKSAGFSTDGGQTWTRFAAVDNETLPPDLDYGCIAISAQSPEHMVWAPANHKAPYYTVDKGVTWKQSEGTNGSGFGAIYSGQKPLCADRVDPDTFYFYNSQDGGIYISTDGGAHFTKAGSVPPSRANAVLKAVPGHAKDLWLSEGEGGGLQHSINGGTTWTKIDGITQCYNMGMGKAQTDGGYPTLYIYGPVGGTLGVYRSTDTGATWDKICGIPLGIFDWMDAIDGDKDEFGKVYLAFAGSGFVYGQLNKK